MTRPHGLSHTWALTTAWVPSLFQPQNRLAKGKEWNPSFPNSLYCLREAQYSLQTLIITRFHFCFELTGNKETSSALRRRNYDNCNFIPPFWTALRFHSFKVAYQLLLKFILLQRVIIALHNSPPCPRSTFSFYKQDGSPVLWMQT